MPTPQNRIAGLDGLRGLSVLSVVLFHAQWFSQGWAGVDVFFGISGLLITTILLESRRQTSSSRRYFVAFYFRRALRILPLAWIIAIVVAAVTDEWHGVLWYAGFAVNWLPDPPAPRELAHYWTLAVEEQFYLVWPLVVYFSRRRTLAAVCLTIPIVDTFCRALLFYGGWSFATAHFLGDATVTRADPIAIGCLIGLMLITKRRIGTTKLWVIGGSAAFSLAAMTTVNELMHRLTGPVYILQPLLVAIIVGCSLQFILESEPMWLSARWLVWTGKISFGIYLIHGALAPWFVKNIPLIPLRAACLVAVSTGLAFITWHVIEQPLLKQKARWPMPGADSGLTAIDDQRLIEDYGPTLRIQD
jgi:peptidoglycan/LPS O-acetylase OafA/YrhL